MASQDRFCVPFRDNPGTPETRKTNVCSLSALFPVMRRKSPGKGMEAVEDGIYRAQKYILRFYIQSEKKMNPKVGFIYETHTLLHFDFCFTIITLILLSGKTSQHDATPYKQLLTHPRSAKHRACHSTSANL